MSGYATPDVLVGNQWLADHLGDPGIRLIEANFNTEQYSSRHIPGALSWTWTGEFQHPVRKDLPDKVGWEALLGRSGITNDTTVIAYGAPENWYATYAFWLLKTYGHPDVRILDGGREKWEAENRPMTTQVKEVEPTTYQAQDPDWSSRALRDHVLESIGNPDRILVDVREPGEFNGSLAPSWTLPDDGGQRGGHIPGAVNIVWSQAKKANGTFKPAEELREIYGGLGIADDKEAITYCVIGGRSNQTWFVLKYLLGYPNVRLYDGSWLEWGGLIGAPVEV
jgi:thiosulfate/3-mercaptopyruvate sulfurtransferase